MSHAQPVPVPPRESPTNMAVQRGLAAVGVARALALFILPFPLLMAIAAAAFATDGSRIAWAAGALACFWTAGAATWQSLAVEARYRRGMRAELPAVPARLFGTVLTAAGCAAAATAGGQPPIGAAIVAAMGAAGHLCFYGRDPRSHRFAISTVDGVDSTAVKRQLEDAYQRLRRIEASARTITVREFCDRLDRIIAIGHRILQQIERDPRDASRVRRFLNLYLDSTERITAEYALTHRQVRDASLDQNFRQLLLEMETTFGEQHRKLLEHDIVSLDVDIEVLNARLKREFRADHQETPR
jgi:5-bromo-4-chloroindolyl phosphate hydrolysis protein